MVFPNVMPAGSSTAPDCASIAFSQGVLYSLDTKDRRIHPAIEADVYGPRTSMQSFSNLHGSAQRHLHRPEQFELALSDPVVDRRVIATLLVLK